MKFKRIMILSLTLCISMMSAYTILAEQKSICSSTHDDARTEENNDESNEVLTLQEEVKEENTAVLPTLQEEAKEENTAVLPTLQEAVKEENTDVLPTLQEAVKEDEPTVLPTQQETQVVLPLFTEGEKKDKISALPMEPKEDEKLGATLVVNHVLHFGDETDIETQVIEGLKSEDIISSIDYVRNENEYELVKFTGLNSDITLKAGENILVLDYKYVWDK